MTHRTEHRMWGVLVVLVATALPAELPGQRPRARDLGIPFDGAPGPLNAITDVAGVEVGHVTLIEGQPPLRVGIGPVRTGVTAILPRGKRFGPVYAGWHSLNGAGEMTGTTWIEESGFLEGPVMLTTTHSVGVVRDGVLKWMRDDKTHEPGDSIYLVIPTVGETYDGFLNDVTGFHITQDHAVEALRTARPGAVTEGSVGGGTGMMCHEFKGGIGTASRRVSEFTVGVLVQCNYGRREDLRIAGVPVGREIEGGMWEPHQPPGPADDLGSIIVVIATDAPMLPHQLRRLAQRPSLGLGRLGGSASNGSGDIFLAFSTANEQAWSWDETRDVETVPNAWMSAFFRATVEATEEAIVNALIAAEDMDGAQGRLYGIPHEELQTVLQRFGRLQP